jgi:dihydroorotate dehydrogenase electron transfer subunit
VTATAWELAVLPEPVGTPSRPAAQQAEVVVHGPLGDRYRLLRLVAPHVAATCAPGQFVMLTAARDGEHAPVLPRPMAVYRTDRDAGTIEVCYGVVGRGTRRLASFRVGESMLVVGPLGRGFRIDRTWRSVLLVGRGIGTCSLTTVAQELDGSGVAVTTVSSARRPEALIGGSVYRAHGARAVHEVTDIDGTSAPAALHDLLVADLDAEPPAAILTCGSHRLVRLSEQLAQHWPGTDVQVSVEAHMACGLGYCHGCSSGVVGGMAEDPLVCRDGPVFGWRPRADRP